MQPPNIEGDAYLERRLAVRAGKLAGPIVLLVVGTLEIAAADWKDGHVMPVGVLLLLSVAAATYTAVCWLMYALSRGTHEIKAHNAALHASLVARLERQRLADLVASAPTGEAGRPRLQSVQSRQSS